MDSVGTTLLVVIIVVLTICFILSAVSGVVQGHPVAVEHQHGARRRAGALVVFVGGPTIVILNLLPDHDRRLLRRPRRRWRPAPRPPAATPRRPGCPAGRSSTGRGGSPGRRSSACSSPGSAAAAPSASSSPASSSSRARSACVWFAHLRRRGDRRRSATAPTSPSRPIEGQLFGLLDTLPLGAVLGVIAMLLVAIFFVSGADAASIVMGTLSQRGTIHPVARCVVFWGVGDGRGRGHHAASVGGEATRCPASRTSRSSWPHRSSS